MARDDIRVWNSPHGGHPRIVHFRVDAGETFLRGEPVGLRNDGQLNQCATDPADADLFGIAAADGVVGTTRDWRTDTTMVENATVPVIVPDPTTYFITSNFSNAGAAFGDASPAAADLGEEVGFSLIGADWGIDQASASDICRIVDVLDANYESVQDSGGTGVHVVFVIVAHQSATLGTADARSAT